MAMISGKKAWLNSLAEAVRKTPDSLYFTMLVLYLLSMLLWKVSFTAPIGLSGRFIKEVLTDCYLVCLGVFRFFSVHTERMGNAAGFRSSRSLPVILCRDAGKQL